MKIYIVLLLIALTSAAEWKIKTNKDWDEIEDTCFERHKNLVEQRGNSKSKDLTKPEFELVLCVFREGEVWSDSKGFSTDRLMMVMDTVATRDNINKKFLRDSLENCADDNSEGSSPLDWGYRYYKCFKDNEVLYETMRKARFIQPDVVGKQ
uniref:OBP5 n=1 Tax=Episyrphus balteatus TaxID=286459 RepID=A0A6H0D3X2_EPIBA|nr:OBP5 [Episyrphus balteatus]